MSLPSDRVPIRRGTETPSSPVRPQPERLWRDVVGEELRAVRLGRRESLQTVAGRARISPQYLSEIERGSKEPSSEILAAVGDSLGTSLLELTTAVAERLRPAEAPARPAVRDVVLAA